jgi:hypothetical protein
MSKDKKEKLAEVFGVKKGVILDRLENVSSSLVDIAKRLDRKEFEEKGIEIGLKQLRRAESQIELLKKQYKGENLENIQKSVSELKPLLKSILDKKVDKEVRVENLKEVIDKLENIKGSFTIENKPKWYSPFTDSNIVKAIAKILRVEIQNDKKKPVPVQLLDSFGNIIEKFGGQQNLGASTGGGTGGGDASAANQTLQITELQNILAELGNQLVSADLSTMETSLSAIDANTDGLEALLTAIASIDYATSANQQTDALTNAELRATAVPVSGAFYPATQPISATALPLPTGASTEATLSAIKTAVEILDNIVSGNEAQVDVITQPARDRTTDNVGAGLQTDAIMNDTTALTPKFANIVATTGDNTIIAAVADKKIRVLAMFGTADVAGTVRFEDGVSGTALTGQVNIADTGGYVLPFNPVGWFETSVNTLLNIELVTSGNFDGSITYIEV